jgi:hypothetical protein
VGELVSGRRWTGLWPIESSGQRRGTGSYEQGRMMCVQSSVRKIGVRKLRGLRGRFCGLWRGGLGVVKT